MNNKYFESFKPILPIFFILPLFYLDQISKNIYSHSDYFTLIYNEGFAFGIEFIENTQVEITYLILLGFALFIFIYEIWWSFFSSSKEVTTIVILFLSGIVSNTWDRIQFAHTRDNIQLANFNLYFNVADIYLCIGAILLIVSYAKIEKKMFPEFNQRKFWGIYSSIEIRYTIIFMLFFLVSQLSIGLLFYGVFRLKLHPLTFWVYIKLLLCVCLVLNLVLWPIAHKLISSLTGPLYAINRILKNFIETKNIEIFFREQERGPTIISIETSLKTILESHKKTDH